MELNRTLNYSQTNISKTLCPPKIENGNFISIVSQYEIQMKNNFKTDQIPVEQKSIFKNNDYIQHGGKQIRFKENNEEIQDSDVEMHDESKIVEITESGNVEIKNNKCFLNKNENNIRFEDNNNYLDFDNKAESISMTNNEILINNSSNNKNYDFMLQDNPINMNDECYLSKWRKLYDSVRDNNNRLMKKNILSILEGLIIAKKINEKNKKIEIVEINYNDGQNNKKIKSRNENSNSTKNSIKDSIDSRTSYDNLTRIITTTEIKNLSNSINSSINSNLIRPPRIDEDEDINKVQNNYQETDVSKILIRNNILSPNNFQNLVDFLEYKDELYMKKLKNDSSNVRISLETSTKKKDYGNIFTINEEDNESYDSLSLSKSIKNSKKVTPSKLNIKKNTFKEIQDMFINSNNDNNDNLDKFYNHKEIPDISIDNVNKKNKKIEENEIGNNYDDDIEDNEDNEDNEDIIINDKDNDLNTNINYNIKNNNRNKKKILSIDLDMNSNNINNTNNNDYINEEKKDNIHRESDDNIEKDKLNDNKGNEEKEKVEDEKKLKLEEEKNEKIIIKKYENEEKDYFMQKPILIKSDKNNNTSKNNIDIDTNKLEYKNNKNNNIKNDFEITINNNYIEKDNNKGKDKDSNINKKENYNSNNVGYNNNFKIENEVHDINTNNNFNDNFIDNNININNETHADDKNNNFIISNKSNKIKINDSKNNSNIKKIKEKIVLSPSIIQNIKSDSFSDLIVSPKSSINTKNNKRNRRNERNKNNNENQIYDLYSNHISLSSNISDGTRQNLFEIFSSFKIIDQKNRKILFLRNDYENESNNNIYNKNHIYEIPLFSYYYILQLFIGKKIGLNGSYEIFIKKLMYKLEKNKIQNSDKTKNKNNKINNKINSEIYNFEQKIKNLRMTYKKLIEKRSLLKTRKEKDKLMKEVDIIKNQNDTKQMFLNLLFLIKNDSYNENKYNSYKEKIMNILKRYCKINKNQNSKEQIKYNHKKLSQSLKDSKIKYIGDVNSDNKNMKNIKSISNKKIFFMFSFMIPFFYIIDYISRYSKITE